VNKKLELTSGLPPPTQPPDRDCNRRENNRETNLETGIVPCPGCRRRPLRRAGQLHLRVVETKAPHKTVADAGVHSGIGPEVIVVKTSASPGRAGSVSRRGVPCITSGSSTLATYITPPCVYDTAAFQICRAFLSRGSSADRSSMIIGRSLTPFSLSNRFPLSRDAVQRTESVMTLAIPTPRNHATPSEP